MITSEFVAKYKGTAEDCSARCNGLDPDVILSQFALETAWGESQLCTVHNNLAGISHFNGWANAGGFCTFPNLNDFAVAYGQVLNNGLYKNVLDSTHESPSAQIEALGASPWAASHYDDGNGPGSSLLPIYAEIAGSPAAVSSPSPVEAEGRETYTVVEGDNLSEIASKHGLTLAEIEAWNPQFAPDYSMIHPGDTVFLSAPTSAPEPAPVEDSAPPKFSDEADQLRTLASQLNAVANTLQSIATELLA